MTDSAEAMFRTLAQPSQHTWLVSQTGIEINDGHVGVARDPSGRPAILVPAPGMKAEVKLMTRGLTARVGALAQGEAFADWLMVTCQSPHLDSIFFRLCDDVLRSLESYEGANAVGATLAVVEHWQDLLAELPSSQLSLAQCAGLLAELHAMEILVSRIGPAKALESWAGPDRARIDFRFEGKGIEVKATLQRDRFKVTVHGLWQLDAAEVGDLYVFAQQLESVPSGGDCLPDAVDRLVAAGVSESDLRAQMGAVGYSSLDEDAYRDFRFKTLDERGFQVTDQTPRIVKGSFADLAVSEAVSAVTYALDLTDLTREQGRCEDARLPFAEVAK